MKSPHHDRCACCGADSEWFALWMKGRHLGVRLRRKSRTQAQLDRDALAAIYESMLIRNVSGHYGADEHALKAIMVHFDDCKMPVTKRRCTCGPDVFLSKEDVITAGYMKEESA